MVEGFRTLGFRAVGILDLRLLLNVCRVLVVGRVFMM